MNILFMQNAWVRFLIGWIGLIAWPMGIASADEVRLISGEVLIGQIVQQTSDGLILEHPILGRLTIPLSKISPTFPTSSASPTPRPSAGPSSSDSAVAGTSPASTSAPHSGVAGISSDSLQTPPSSSWDFFDGWHARLELGLNGSQGNSVSSDFHTGLTADKKTEEERWDFRALYRLSRSNLQTTSNNAVADLRRDWLLPDSPWFIFGQARYEFDEFQSWSHRVESLAGPGYDLFNQPDLLWNVRLGFGAEKRFGDVDDRTRPESGLSTDIDWKVTTTHRLQSSLNYYQDLKDADAYRLVGRVAWLIRIDQTKGLSLKLSLEDEYDAKPQGDSLRNDFRYLASLVWEF